MLKKIKDPASALTHFAGCVMAALAAVPLLCKAAREPGRLYFIAMAVFALSMVLLYAASTTYHTVDSTDKVNRRLRKLDHMMIFVLIAGGSTPICLITLRGAAGRRAVRGGVGRGPGGHCHQSPVDDRPQVVFFRVMYCHGLAVRVYRGAHCERAVTRGVWLAFGGRHHLHGGRRALCAEASVVQCAPQGVWHARNFPCVRHGGQRLPLCADVLFCHARFGIVPGPELRAAKQLAAGRACGLRRPVRTFCRLRLLARCVHRSACAPCCGRHGGVVLCL